MSNCAASKWLAAHKLTVNRLAHHVEFNTTLDLNMQHTTPRGVGSFGQLAAQLQHDSCGVWSVGPIEHICHQGRAPLLGRVPVAPARWH